MVSLAEITFSNILVETTLPLIPCGDHLSTSLVETTLPAFLKSPHFLTSLAAVSGPAYGLGLYSKGILTRDTPSSFYPGNHLAFLTQVDVALGTSFRQH